LRLLAACPMADQQPPRALITPPDHHHPPGAVIPTDPLLVTAPVPQRKDPTHKILDDGTKPVTDIAAAHPPPRQVTTPTHNDETRSYLNCARTTLARLVDCTDADLAALFGFQDGPLPDDMLHWFEAIAKCSGTRLGHKHGPIEPKYVTEVVKSYQGKDQRFFCDIVWDTHTLKNGYLVRGGGHAVEIEPKPDGSFTTRDYQWRMQRPFPHGMNYYEYDNMLLPGFRQGTHRIRDLYWMENREVAKNWIRKQIPRFRARTVERFVTSVSVFAVNPDAPPAFSIASTRCLLRRGAKHAPSCSSRIAMTCRLLYIAC
jgi:hypothetical protein